MLAEETLKRTFLIAYCIFLIIFLHSDLELIFLSIFQIWLPLCSPVSLRALLCREPFMSDFELSQVSSGFFRV